jgi:acylphosphatase
MAVKIKVIGKVQGVFYRASSKNTAENLGLTGWVLNETDGSVTIHAEGKNTQELINWSRKGPEFARVDDQEVEEVPDEGFTTFEIRR